MKIVACSNEFSATLAQSRSPVCIITLHVIIKLGCTLMGETKDDLF